MTALKELAEMLDAATGPSRELDAELAVVFDGKTFGVGIWSSMLVGEDGNFFPVPDYTSSVDAALALVERLLPGATTVHAQQWKHPTAERPESWTWELSIYPRGRTTATYSPTAPIAILRALVAALATHEKTDEA